MDRDRILVIAFAVLSVLLVVTTLLIRLSEPVFEVPAISSGFGLDGAVFPAKAAPVIRQMSLEYEPEDMPEDEPELSPPDTMQDEPQFFEPDQRRLEDELITEADTDAIPDMSEYELLAEIRNSVDGILLCIMLLMSTGIVVLILKIVYPLFRG